LGDNYFIRTMSQADIDRAVEWAAAEGWNPGNSDAGCFATVDPDGFFGGWLGDRMIASISVINYSPSFAFLGFYIVEAPYRGQGYGYRLWRHAMLHADRRLVGLDGVLAEQDNYRRSGFELAYRNVRYGGGLPANLDIGEAARHSDIEIVPVDRLAPEIAAFDRQVFPASRDAFLQSWVSAHGHVSRAAYRDKNLIGYGVIRPCRNGHKIGPLFAEDSQAAEALLSALVAGSGIEDGSGAVFLDVPEPNRASVELAQDLGLTPVFKTARMYTGRAPAIATGKIFGVTSFELG
jgi:GNAT superfamily N-acetyltransferase